MTTTVTVIAVGAFVCFLLGIAVGVIGSAIGHTLRQRKADLERKEIIAYFESTLLGDDDD